MPIYEYYCRHCRRRVSLFYRTMSAATATTPACPHCQGQDLRRLISRVAVVRSEDSRLDEMADPARFAGLDEDDPRALGRMMREMGNELGEDMDPEFNEVIDRLESGQSPDEIEKSMPDLAGGEGGGGADFDL